ncbi:MAG TPA: tRNA (N(6)-L-threonylcarbamoyladenosine(37)-C(2))-methylthiotransferase MtaB [Dehalococcoidia bacterium]|nr:tRNA (N(6)-L-threonylcarbamoyladenosine(37)-C(2))-methylthiotransferase MtaB [Dehalococcoidia bacterium]
MSESARPATAAILTLGCKLNIADSEVMARRLRDAGWNVGDRLAEAEAVIVNSCSVTDVADQKSRHLVRLARRVAPNATVALTGCLLETAPAEKIDALGADLVFRQPDQLALADRLIEAERATGNRPQTTRERPSDALNLYALPRHLGQREGEGQRDENPEATEKVRAFKTRAFISAQEGCNDVCAFCIIPRTRGRERSKSVEWVVEEALKREAEGVKEIVITGTQLGAYGRDRGDLKPYDLLKALLEKTSVARIRMSSLQPQDLSDELLSLWDNPRLCRHFHLALQSGSESVLQRMRRRYTKAQYRDGVQRLRVAVPDVAITTDVIAGFPGESEDEFEECYEFCEEMAFAGIHVFPYSQRSGTVAFKLPGQVQDAVKKQRVHRLIDLASRMSRAYRERLVGTTTSVLWETRRDGPWEGLTDTYVRVRTASDAALANRLTAVRLTALSEDGLIGEVMV